MRILLVQQEWPRDFRRSTQWSYISSLGYLEALEACGARTTLLTTPWLIHARRLIAAGEFEQVWVIDLAHLDATDEFFGWLETVAPVRVGLLGESLQHTEQEIRDTPSLAGREKRVRSRSRSFTHLLLADEADARSFTRTGKPTLWSPGGMLRRPPAC